MTLSSDSATSPSAVDRATIWALRSLSALAGAVVVLIVLFVAMESFPALRTIGFTRFFTDASWHPDEALYNVAPMLWGTLVTTAGALLIAAPFGVLAAVFRHFYAPQAIATVFRRVLELMAGVPSVVYGLWGLLVVVPWIAQMHPPGASLLAGILVLAIMIVPTVALLSDAAIAQVPEEYLRAAAALGLSRWGKVWRVVLPAAKRGLATGLLLGAGRAIGETMAVLMVCGNVVQMPSGLFDPVRTLTANIALEMAFALGTHRSALFVTGLVLMGLVSLLVGLAERLERSDPHG